MYFWAKRNSCHKAILELVCIFATQLLLTNSVNWNSHKNKISSIIHRCSGFFVFAWTVAKKRKNEKNTYFFVQRKEENNIYNYMLCYWSINGLNVWRFRNIKSLPKGSLVEIGYKKKWKQQIVYSFLKVLF